MVIPHVHSVWKFGLGNAGRRLGEYMPASRDLGTGDASPGTAGPRCAHRAPISVKIAGGIWCPQCTEPLQSEIGTPSVINTVGE